MSLTDDDAKLTVHLKDEEETLAFGARLAKALMDTDPTLTLLLNGDLGAGKTTLVRGIISAMPGGGDAQVSSPSFNIMNLYPTEPETAHFDLYRLELAGPDESLLEYMEAQQHLVIVEWAQYLSETFFPDDYVYFSWQECPSGRCIRLTAQGKKAKETLHAVKEYVIDIS